MYCGRLCNEYTWLSSLSSCAPSILAVWFPFGGCHGVGALIAFLRSGLPQIQLCGKLLLEQCFEASLTCYRSLNLELLRSLLVGLVVYTRSQGVEGIVGTCMADRWNVSHQDLE